VWLFVKAVSQLVCLVVVGIEYPEVKDSAIVPLVVNVSAVKPVGTVILVAAFILIVLSAFGLYVSNNVPFLLIVRVYNV